LISEPDVKANAAAQVMTARASTKMTFLIASLQNRNAC
jgi:hypothetical protein